MQRFIYDRSATNIRDWSLAYSFTCLCVSMTLCPHSPCIYVSISPFHLVSLQMSLSNYVLCLLLEVLPRTKLLVRLMVVLLDGCLVGRSFGLSVIIDGKLQFHCSYLSYRCGYWCRISPLVWWTHRKTDIHTYRTSPYRKKQNNTNMQGFGSVWYWPDPDPTFQNKPDRDPDPWLFLDQIRIQVFSHNF